MDAVIGLEIHQQLLSDHKLFCRCPLVKSGEFPLEITRSLRPVAGEMGEIDPAALYEFTRRRNFTYKINNESACLIETDEEPPIAINKEALRTAIQVCKLLNCCIIDEIHVMRKNVVDGSSVSGFQRTALIGIEGFIETSFGKTIIKTVCIEEDSAPALGRYENNIQYRLDRMGTPLIEIATDASIKSPEQAKEVAAKIGMILRSVKVVRGIGSIRQDVNVSISGGARVEIKGFQELDEIPKLVENEINRQLVLISIKNEIIKKGSKMDLAIRDVTDIFKGTKFNLISKAIIDGGRVTAIKVPGFEGLMGIQCGDRTLGKELSGYAGAFGLGIIHNAESEKFSLQYEFSRLYEIFKAEKKDVIIIIAGKGTEQAAEAVAERIRHMTVGVPKETRVSDNIGSKYTRPLPGSERMYPESDVILTETEDFLDMEIPKTIEEKKELLVEEIPLDMAEQIVKSHYFTLFEELKNIIDPVFAASTLLFTLKDVKRRGYNIENITNDKMKEIFTLIKDGKISRSAVPQSLIMIAGGSSVKEVTEKLRSISERELEEIVAEAIEKNPGKTDSAIVGIVISKTQGRADGKKAMGLVKRLRH